VAITTAGYDGTINEVQLADMLHRYSVEGPEDFKATTQAGDRIVAIGNGTALGPGTVDVATNLPTIQFNAATGTRWDLVVLRRDWQPPGGVSEIKIIEGGSSQAYPTVGTAATQWNRRPGIVDDQPLYLQQVNGTLLGTRIDLRCWNSHSGLVAVHEMAKTYLEKTGSVDQVATPGAEVLIGRTKHYYTIGANNVPEWFTQDITESAADVTNMGPGFEAVTTNWHKPRLRRQGNIVHMFGAVRRTTGEFGNMLTVPVGYRPTNGQSMFIGAGVSSNGIAYELAMTNGVVAIVTGYATESDTGAFTVFPITASWSIT